MGPVSGLVLFLVIWFMTFLCILPIRVQTQGDLGEIVPGTHAGSPEHHHLRKKMWITTGLSVVIWAIVATLMLTGTVTLDDIDLYRRFGPDAG
jgi:predicted secreted protein